MANSISILLPTRGRIERLKIFLGSLSSNASGKNKIEVILGIDEDDIHSVKFDCAFPKIKVVKTISQRTTMGALNTRCLENSSGNILILGNDDIIVKTKNWDEKIVDRVSLFKNEIYLLYPKDNHKSNSISTFPILSRKCVQLLVEPYPKIYKGSLIDLHIFEIFQRLKKGGYDVILQLDDVIFEHKHIQLNEELNDKTYSDRNRFCDDKTFYSLLYLRRKEAQVLIKYIYDKNHIQNIDSNYKYFPKNILKFFLSIIIDDELPLIFRLKHASWMSLRSLYSILTGQN